MPYHLFGPFTRLNRKGYTILKISGQPLLSTFQSIFNPLVEFGYCYGVELERLQGTQKKVVKY